MSDNTVAAVQLEHVEKTYPHSSDAALLGISLKIFPGEKVGLVGANGSGKTTILKIIMHFLLAEKGKVEVLGESDLELARKWIGFLPEHQEGLENFTPEELFRSAGKFHGFSEEQIAARIKELGGFLDIEPYKNNLLNGFSKGMIQRVFLGIALFHSPQILLLDEPMSGLDPEGREGLLQLLSRLTDFTLIYTSHQLEDVELLCERVLFLNNGVIAGDLNLNEQLEGGYRLHLDQKILTINSAALPVKIRVVDDKKDIVKIEFNSTPEQLQKFLNFCGDHDITVRKVSSRTVLKDYYQKFVAGGIDS